MNWLFPALSQAALQTAGSSSWHMFLLITLKTFLFTFNSALGVYKYKVAFFTRRFFEAPYSFTIQLPESFSSVHLDLAWLCEECFSEAIQANIRAGLLSCVWLIFYIFYSTKVQFLNGSNALIKTLQERFSLQQLNHLKVKAQHEN